MRFDSAGYPFVAAACAPALAAWLLGAPVAALVLLALPVAVLLFFRDPERVTPPAADVVYAPADGRVMHAGPARPNEAPEGTWLQVTIFLSLLDVHINRTPVAGIVERVDYVPGSFLAAFKAESYRNEHSEIRMRTARGPVVVRQVVGLLARRVVCRLTPGQQLAVGERIGLMKFGSRMDVFLPPGSVVSVTAGVSVRAGETPIGRLPPVQP